jgi:hypothetical protein
MADAQAIVKAMEEAGLQVLDGPNDVLHAGGTAESFARFRGVPLDEVEGIEKALREYAATQKEWADKGVSIPPPSVLTGYFKLEQLADRLRRLRGGES